jgi:CheY-like chemotaxis protein
MHGGSVTLKSSGILGEGSNFTVQLPVHPTDLYRQIEKKPQYEGIPVLLMDDEPNSQERMRRILAGFGCKVYTANDNMDAIRLAKEISPRMIMLDLQLPLESSLDIIKQLRRDIKTGNIPILSMNYLWVQHNPLPCIDAGANECLIKPLSTQLVSNLLENYLLKH